MDPGLTRDPLFVGLTRPQMFAGVTYSYCVINGVVSTEFFLIFKSAWVILLAVAVHFAGWLACLREPRIFDVWLIRLARCPRIPNYRFWRCNSYRA
ncbi:type IV secretion system protein VirB3 [Novosphingobium sp. APW14]|nr:type IV secretion system protein VirB3 [Novosphingobium sp. APW14]MDT9013805.1 type IV secretion system protein VirB3 [Novosphingobium sp. APW14]